MRPRYGIVAVYSSALDSVVCTNPAGIPTTKAGRAAPYRIMSMISSRVVGTFPTTTPAEVHQDVRDA